MPILRCELRALAGTLREIRGTDGDFLLTESEAREDQVIPLAIFALSHMMRMCEDAVTKFKEATELLQQRTAELDKIKSMIGMALGGAK